MGRLDGKVAVVTGAGSGSGRGMAVRFAQDGAQVVIADVSERGMEESGELVRKAGAPPLLQRCDVTNKADVDALTAATVARFGHLDVTVANAVVSDGGVDCLAMTEAEFDRTIAINLKGVFLTLQAAANQMRAQGTGGRLIAIASIMSEWGSATSPAYCASKGGVRQLVKSFALACAPFRITCNAIGPGFIDTPMTARIQEDDRLRTGILRRVPLGRFGEPEDVAAVAAFLAGDESKFITGTTIYPDGGILAGNYMGSVAQ
jgi:NAD(P)-dependent dehydrogenase (short-subunit alcohol dehydrogenase family)